MNTTELKALAEKATKPISELADMNADEFAACDAMRMEFKAKAGFSVLALIAALESAQDERRALLATEQNLRELVKRLYVELFHCNQQMVTVLDEEGEPMFYTGSTVSDALSDARALLEKTT